MLSVKSKSSAGSGKSKATYNQFGKRKHGKGPTNERATQGCPKKHGFPFHASRIVKKLDGLPSRKFKHLTWNPM